MPKPWEIDEAAARAVGDRERARWRAADDLAAPMLARQIADAGRADEPDEEARQFVEKMWRTLGALGGTAALTGAPGAGFTESLALRLLRNLQLRRSGSRWPLTSRWSTEERTTWPSGLRDLWRCESLAQSRLCDTNALTSWHSGQEVLASRSAAGPPQDSWLPRGYVVYECPLAPATKVPASLHTAAPDFSAMEASSRALTELRLALAIGGHDAWLLLQPTAEAQGQEYTCILRSTAGRTITAHLRPGLAAHLDAMTSDGSAEEQDWTVELLRDK